MNQNLPALCQQADNKEIKSAVNNVNTATMQSLDQLRPQAGTKELTPDDHKAVTEQVMSIMAQQSPAAQQWFANLQNVASAAFQDSEATFKVTIAANGS